LPRRLTIFGYRPTTRQKWSSDLRTGKHYVTYVSEIRDMRSRYIAGLLKREWNTMLGLIGGRGRRGADDHALSGNSVIDVQHQRLSRYADELKTTLAFGRPVDDAIAISDALIRDLDQHFRDEEAILAESDYPGAAKHAPLHRELLNSATELLRQCRAGASSMGELFRFLVDDVLTKHMVVADRECISYMGKPALASAGHTTPRK